MSSSNRRPERRRARRAVASAACLVLAASAAGADVLVESGQSSFARYCSACHGMGARGDGPLAPILRTPPSDLTRIAARRNGVFPDAEIADFIDGRRAVQAHGGREMPVWGRVFSRRIVPDSAAEEVNRGELWVLVEYLKSIQVPGEGP